MRDADLNLRRNEITALLHAAEDMIDASVAGEWLCEMRPLPRVLPPDRRTRPRPHTARVFGASSPDYTGRAARFKRPSGLTSEQMLQNQSESLAARPSCP